MVSSTLRSVAPAFAASLFAASLSHNLLGGNMVFFVLAAVSMCGLRAALLLPRRLGADGA